MITIREYKHNDRNGCLAVFDSNTPRFFKVSERAEFAKFLDALPGPYFVAEKDGSLLACGGFVVGSDTAVAVRCWGMVDCEHHGCGIGKLLLAHRMNEIRRDPAVRRVAINTSQHTRAFFEKFGFIVTNVVRDDYGPGLDRCEMSLIVTPDSQKSNSGAIITE